MRLKSFTSQPEDVATYGPALTTEDGTPRFTVTLTGQTTKGALVARLSDVRPRNRPTPCAACGFMFRVTACPRSRMMNFTTRT